MFEISPETAKKQSSILIKQKQKMKRLARELNPHTVTKKRHVTRITSTLRHLVSTRNLLQYIPNGDARLDREIRLQFDRLLH